MQLWDVTYQLLNNECWGIPTF